MDINLYDVIVRARATPKAQRLTRELKHVVLEVHPQATKPMVIRALKTIFNAEVLRIGIVTGEEKARRRSKGSKKQAAGRTYKRAIIKFKEGTESAVMNLSSAMPHVAPGSTESAE